MSVAASPPLPDVESREWLRDLRAGGASSDEAVARLRVLLVRAATFEVMRRRAGMPYIRGETHELISEAADAALVAIRDRIDDFRGESRFTTWACKFAVLEAAVKLRRLAWQGRELPTAPLAMNDLAGAGLEPPAALEQRELLSTLQRGIERLTPRQREVLVALAVNAVPIDVLAKRMGTTRGALYETLRDARANLRRHVATAGLAVR